MTIRYAIWKEAKGFSVWTIGLSGSKGDCCGYFTNKRSAQAYIRKQYARKGQV